MSKSEVFIKSVCLGLSYKGKADQETLRPPKQYRSLEAHYASLSSSLVLQLGAISSRHAARQSYLSILDVTSIRTSFLW